MELKIQSYHFRKIILIFGILLLLLGIFRLNVREFFALKQEKEFSAKQFSSQNDKSAILSFDHIGLIFENKKLESAIFVLPDTGYEYNIDGLLLNYKIKQKFNPQKKPASSTVYITKGDTSCIYEETCGENFEKILKSAEKYDMVPQAYDLTDRIILPENPNKTNMIILNK